MYIASLFGEANRIPINILKSYADTTRRIIVYAHEFKVSEKSGLPVVVKGNFYMGGHYMVEGRFEEQSIYFNNPVALQEGKTIFLNVSLETINQRLNQ